MPRILVLYYSAFGQTEAMARAVAEGAREVPGALVELRRVPELVPEDLARQSGYQLDQPAPVATADELARYDAVLFGTPTRFGRMAAQMRSFLDRAGGLWSKGLLTGKIGSVFFGDAAQSWSFEPILQAFHSTMAHHGMHIAAPPIALADLQAPAAAELEQARAHGRYVATLAKKRAA